MSKVKHPMQPVVTAKDKIIRFKQNEIVRYLLDNGGIDMNKLRILNFNNEDWNQFAQLIGYSVSGFGDLSYADPDIVKEADEIAEVIIEEKKRKAKEKRKRKS